MNKRGFTLIEIIIFIVVFTIGVIGVLYLFFNILGKSSNPILRHKTVQTAQKVLETIISKKFDEDTPNGGGTILLSSINIGAESGETSLSQFDDVDDFVDSCNTPKSYSPTLFNINNNYEIKITINYVSIDSAGNTNKTSCSVTNYKLIEVHVKNNSTKEEVKLEYIKGNF